MGMQAGGAQVHGESSIAGGSSAASSANADPSESSFQRSSCAAEFVALSLMARLHHVAADADSLCHALGKSRSEPVTTEDLLLAARHLGLKARLRRTAPERLSLTPLPALALMHVGHVVLLAQCDGKRVLFIDPSAPSGSAGVATLGLPTIEPLESFAARWGGRLILVASRASLTGALAKFDFSWFIPSIVKYRRLFGEVLVVSLFLQLFALVSPLFFQVVMDKVLVHRGLTTLDVLVIGLTVVVVY
jgi:subfamily B ATP-binding cassette protein HlyB/CyaB